GVGALLFERLENAGVDRLVLQDLALIVGEDADRDAPGALARQYPVGPVGDHGPEARLTRRRHETRGVDRGERTLAQGGAVLEGLVHVDEPLRRVAKDDRLLGTPAMGIGVL